MFEPDVEYPYWQPEQAVPYQPYKGPTEPARTQQQVYAPSPTIRHASPTQSTQSTQSIQANRASQARSTQARSATPRLSKAEALAFVEECKKWLVAGSIVTFGLLVGLVASHITGTTSNQSNNQAAPASNGSSTSPSTSPSNNGGFFQQGGSNFGNGNFGQQPVSGSHTS